MIFLNAKYLEVLAVVTITQIVMVDLDVLQQSSLDASHMTEVVNMEKMKCLVLLGIQAFKS